VSGVRRFKMVKNWIKTSLYAGIPALIAMIVFFLPNYIQELLVLKMDKLTWWNWFSYIFVHENTPHLIRNLVFYSLSIITAYFICPKEHKENFYKPYLAVLILTPLISLIITFLIWKFGGILLLNHRGFSGLTSAGIGILGFFVAKRIYTSWKIKNKMILLHLCYFVIMPSLAIMAWNLSKILSIVAFILWGLMILNLVLVLKKEKIVLDNSKWTRKEFLIICFSLAVLFFGALLLVPEKLVSESGSMVNAIAHLIGFVVGFWTYFIWDVKYSK
jgi:membrane associated rhomboid family serine protease